MPNTAYLKSPAGVAKSINVGLGAGIIVLSWITQPTERQEQIVDSTWKEYGYFALSISGVVFSLISLTLFLLLDRTHSSIIRIIDGVLHFYAAICFLVWGFFILQQTISIFLSIGDCCRKHFEDPEGKCTLPGYILEISKSMSEGTFDSAKIPGPPGIPGSDLKECPSDINDAWMCNLCINQLIQPLFEWKGAAGALGILNALFYAIVGAVALKLIRETFRIC